MPLTSHPLKNKQLRIAMAQIVCIDGDLSGNLVRIENAIREAKEQQAGIIVFPESCLLGWVNPEAFRRASTIPGRDSDIICQLAKKYKIYICIGLDEKDGDKLYDAAILVDDQGNILLKHRKINVLPTLMTPPYSEGEGVSVAKTRFGTIGILICADSFQDDLLASMKEKKPDLLLIPYGWAAVENEWPAHGEDLVKVVRKAAGIMKCPVIGTNLVGQISHGPWTGQVYGGQSVSYNPANDSLVAGKDRERDIVMVSVPLSY
ncbi:MAG: carbon-nitrogen hydrolase family protein [Bacteroidetes bacterium]|nr:carbon-nitrogen hydrolase family protein [Bacteroidota bacterium]